MKVIIAGSRGFTNYGLAKKHLDKIMVNAPSSTTIICGGARGADLIGEIWAEHREFNIEYFIPEWDLRGKSAGYIRNEEMAKNATHCIVFWDGVSKGSKHMIDLAKKYKLETRVIRI